MKAKDDEIQGIIDAYNKLVKNIDTTATDSEEGRAYGGIVRAGKGELVESTAKQMVLIAWQSLGKKLERITFNTTKIKIPINKEYVNSIKNPEVKEYLLKNIDKCYYSQKTDLHVFIDNQFVMAIECKAYTENAMMKRILVDFTLLKKAYPKLNCILFQLESQLGGDYSKLNENPMGSFPTHNLLSHFDIELHIITILEGERKVKEPIHKKEFFKELKKESLEKAVDVFSEILKEYA